MKNQNPNQPAPGRLPKPVASSERPGTQPVAEGSAQTQEQVRREIERMLATGEVPY